MTDDQIIARALEITRERLVGGSSLAAPRDLVAHAAMRLHDERREVLLAYWQTADYRLIGVEEVATGSAAAISISTFDIARRALLAGADAAALVHNHPTERQAHASDRDRISAAKIDKVLANIGIFVTGHFVVAAEEAEDIRTGSRYRLTVRDSTDAPRCPRCDFLLYEESTHQSINQSGEETCQP